MRRKPKLSRSARHVLAVLSLVVKSLPKPFANAVPAAADTLALDTLALDALLLAPAALLEALPVPLLSPEVRTSRALPPPPPPAVALPPPALAPPSAAAVLYRSKEPEAIRCLTCAQGEFERCCSMGNIPSFGEPARTLGNRRTIGKEREVEGDR